jgi:type II secretory pathway pseudopilin PulG
MTLLEGEASMKKTHGFTIAEFILAMAIFLLGAYTLGCIAPGFIKSRSKAREAEVKSNIHSIQIALERYAVDTGGIYPIILYGGDDTDTFATPWSPPPLYNPGYRYHKNDVDALITFHYLGQYPYNPFSDKLKKPIITNPGANGFEPLEIKPGRVNIWSLPVNRGEEYIRRKVGGENGNIMWDVSEGQRHPPWPIIVVPDPEQSTRGYINPLPGPEFKDATRYSTSFQFWLTPGNFYYYALFDEMGGYSSFIDTDGDGVGNIEYPIMGNVIGYILVGYGDIHNPGEDYYDLYGIFGGIRFTEDSPDGQVVEGSKGNGGPDGRPDGVIIGLLGGSDALKGLGSNRIGE